MEITIYSVDVDQLSDILESEHTIVSIEWEGSGSYFTVRLEPDADFVESALKEQLAIS